MNKKILPYIFFAIITLAIMLPLYQPGFIFLLDMVFTPHMHLGNYIQNGLVPPHFPLLILIKLVSSVLPMDIIQKIILSLLLFLPAAFMYRLARKYLDTPWATIAGIFYTLNPWVYERFLAGHWLVLLGYAFLPLLIKLYIDLLETKSKRSAIKFGCLFAILPIISIHFAYISIFFLLTLLITYYWLHKNSLRALISNRVINTGMILLIATIAVNAFWLSNFFQVGATYTAITAQDFSGFQTVSTDSWGVFANTLALYGFWNTDYALPKDIFPYWKFISGAILLLAVIGGYRAWRNKNPLGRTLIILFLPALVISVGVAHNFSKPIIEILLAYFPGFRGLRETAKLTSLLAFSYAFFVPIAGQWITDKLIPVVMVPARLIKLTVLGFCILLAAASTSSMFNGFHNQLRPAYYPESWSIANQLLQDAHASKVLFLPWWGYLRLPFADNNLIANPAYRFFDVPVLASKNFENSYVVSTSPEFDATITSLVNGNITIDEAIPYFKSQGISHIMVVEEQDTAQYQFLNNSKKIKRVLAMNDVVLFVLP